ncbi:MAG: tetratricopeptide repeat protein, partial [Acidimicrobiales bacterium]
MAFRKALDLKPADATISFNLGLALFSADEPRAAVAPLERGSADPAHTVDAHLLVGVCYFDLNAWTRSIRELEMVRRVRASDQNALFILAKDYRNSGEPAKELQVAADLLKAHPDSPYVSEILGETYDMASEPEKAEEEFKQAITASPDAPELHFMLGYLYWRWKHYAEAVGPLEVETRISPDLA